MSVPRPVNPHGLPASALISHGVVVPAAGLVFVSGQLPWDADRRLVGPGDLALQFGQASANVDAVLHAAGATRSDVVQESIFVVGYLGDRRAELLALVAATRVAGVAPPASTIVGVESLAADGFLVEIEVVATVRASAEERGA